MAYQVWNISSNILPLRSNNIPNFNDGFLLSKVSEILSFFYFDVIFMQIFPNFEYKVKVVMIHSVWKSVKNVSFEFFNFGHFSSNFCLIKTDLSGKTFWFSKTRQNWLFLAFLINFCPLKCHFAIDMSGNAAWPLSSQKLTKIDYFWHF